ncbi:MAG: DUF1573 domain-containing protein [Bacteroidales bacterium]|nr:DUF1573 domain-containing protein [Bacteroidales bacterium]
MKKLLVIISVILCQFSVYQMIAQGSQMMLDESKVLTFDKKIHDFGDIIISDGAVKCTFTFTNISDSPIVVHNIISSCGCTTPQWTRSPIQPGEKGKVEVVFKNDQGPYPFDKTLTLYVSGVNRPVILRVRGVAHEKEKNVDELFYGKIGQMGINKSVVSLRNIEQGILKQDDIDVANLSKSPLKVETIEVTRGLLLTVYPNPIPPKSMAKLTYTVDPTLLPQQEWGKQTFTGRFVLNGKKQQEKFSVSAVIIDNFRNLNAKQVKDAPIPIIERSYYDFGTAVKGTVIEVSYKIKNKGKSELLIYKVESEKSGLSQVGHTPFRIKAGGSATLKLKFDTREHSGEMINILTLITNSPSKPMINLFITGTIK